MKDRLSIDNLTAIIINYLTPVLTEQFVRQLLGCYPTLKVMLVDNGSHDGISEPMVMRLAAEFSTIRCVVNERNLGHGIGLHRAITSCATRYVLTLDPDSIVRKCGFIEPMLECFSDASLFAIGALGHVDNSGVKQGKRPYVHPAACMLDRGKYVHLKPMRTLGAPARDTMFDAVAHGYKLLPWPVLRGYIKHLGGGSRAAVGKRMDAWRRERGL